MVDPDIDNLTEYVIFACGIVKTYNGSYQFEIASVDCIQEDQFYNNQGTFFEDNSITRASINPAPYVVIPTIGEVLDYSYSFPPNSRVTIRILDFNGRFVTSLLDRYHESGGEVKRDEGKASWNGRDYLGQIVPPGTYLIHIES